MAVVVVDESAKPPVMAGTIVKSSPSAKSRMSPAKGKARTGPGAEAAALLPPAPLEWERGGGVEERGELARQLGEESKGGSSGSWSGSWTPTRRPRRLGVGPPVRCCNEPTTCRLPFLTRQHVPLRHRVSQHTPPVRPALCHAGAIRLTPSSQAHASSLAWTAYRVAALAPLGDLAASAPVHRWPLGPYPMPAHALLGGSTPT